MHMGCRTQVPLLCAANPVKNGTTAPPELPAEEMKPMAIVCNLRGRSLVKTVAAAGYTGPSSNPRMATDTEFPMTLGINQDKI